MKTVCCLVLVALCASACTRAPAARPATSAPAHPAPKNVWMEHEIPGTGFFARFPTKPREGAAWTKSSPSFLYRALAVDAPAQAQSYALCEIAIGARGANADILSTATQFVRNVKRREDVRLGSFRGVEVLGESEKGAPTLARAFAVGGSIVTATAIATNGGALDMGAARQFVDSVRVEMPWRVEPIPALGMSLALPAKVFPVEASNRNERVFFLGGADTIYYLAAVSPIAEALRSNPDQALTFVVQGYATRGTVTFDSPLELDGARGREVLMRAGPEYMRIHVYAHEDRLYQMMISSTAKERLTTEDAKRFFESLRWFD